MEKDSTTRDRLTKGRKTRLRAFLASLFCLGILPSYAMGWDFSLDASVMWSYSSYSQLGDRGFFGKYGVDNSTFRPGGASSCNAWLGTDVTNLLSSGADNANSYLFMKINPRFKVNKAVDVYGQYVIGSWGYSHNLAGVQYPVTNASPHWDPVGALQSSSYSTMTLPGVGQSISPGYWNMLWVETRTPLGTIVFGKRPFKFGTGFFFNGEENTTTEALLVAVPHGPLSFSLGWYPWRRILDKVYVDPIDVSHQYFNSLDKSWGRHLEVLGSALYEAGPVSLGVLAAIYSFHIGPEGILDPDEKQDVVPIDAQGLYGVAFVKYNNGKVFLNAEVDWFQETYHLKPNGKGTLDPGFSPYWVEGGFQEHPRFYSSQYREHWRYMVEMGTYSGPVKLSLIWVWIPGPDRRAGMIIDRQTSMYGDLFTNTGLFRPYNMIMVGSYGTGNNSISTITNGGYLTDANAWGARLDYALAANLNVFCSFFQAVRVSHGYGWGFIRPGFNDKGVGDGTVYYTRHGTIDLAPAIPDSDLGWELGWGFSWNLLENYRLTGTFAFWQPGGWFNYACIDKSNPGWKNPNVGNKFGIIPDRTIDPIFAFNVGLRVGF